MTLQEKENLQNRIDVFDYARDEIDALRTSIQKLLETEAIQIRSQRISYGAVNCETWGTCPLKEVPFEEIRKAILGILEIHLKRALAQMEEA